MSENHAELNHAALRLLIGNSLEYLGFRFTQVALPLVVLRDLGSPGSAGLVGGLAGVPILLSPWWARTLRQRVASGRALAAIGGAQSAAVAAIPLATLTGNLSASVLAGTGLAIGAGSALVQPGRAAMLGDLGDRIGAGAGIRLITWDDTARRTSMVIGPAMAGLAVQLGWLHPVLWAEAGAFLVSAVLALPIRVPRRRSGGSGVGTAAAPTIRASIASSPEVLKGWALRGTSCAGWGVFTLGLAALGVRHGTPGLLLGWGLSGYGLGALTSTCVVVPRATSWPVSSTARVGWLGQGAAFAIMSAFATPVPIGVLGFLSGAFTTLGIAAVTQEILRATEGPARGAAMSGQTVVVNTTSSLGLLLGGPLLAAVGPRTALLAGGLTTAAVALLVGDAPWSRKRERAIVVPSGRDDQPAEPADHSTAVGEAAVSCWLPCQETKEACGR